MGALESIKILSKDELENVRAYVAKAKSLPLDNEGVEKILSKVLTGALENFHDELATANVHLVKASRVLRITGKFIDVTAFIDSSKTKIDGVKEFHSLTRFVLDLTGVRNDWLKIKNEADELMDVLRP
jgi:hypothetical protein